MGKERRGSSFESAQISARTIAETALADCAIGRRYALPAVDTPPTSEPTCAKVRRTRASQILRLRPREQTGNVQLHSRKTSAGTQCKYKASRRARAPRFERL